MLGRGLRRRCIRWDLGRSSKLSAMSGSCHMHRGPSFILYDTRVDNGFTCFGESISFSTFPGWVGSMGLRHFFFPLRVAGFGYF